jgi:hypothetical protein
MTLYYLLKDIPAKQFSFNGYPAVRIFSTQPGPITSKNQFKLDDAWTNWIKAMNTRKAYQYLSQPTSGVLFSTWLEKVINYVRGKKRVSWVAMPKYQCLGFFTNIVTAEIVGNWAQVRTLRYQNGPPSPFLVNHQSTPDLIHLFTVERNDATIVSPPTFGEPVYVPLISTVPIYVETKYLQSLPR